MGLVNISPDKPAHGSARHHVRRELFCAAMGDTLTIPAKFGGAFPIERVGINRELQMRWD
jgi:hypothetical protein